MGNISATYANLPLMFFQSIRHDPFEKIAKEGGWQKTSLPYSDCCSEPFSYAAIHLDYTCSLVLELLNGANYICNDIVLPHGGPYDCMPFSIRGLFEINDGIVQVLSML